MCHCLSFLAVLNVFSSVNAVAAIVYTEGFGYRRELGGLPDRISTFVQDIDMNGDGAYDFYFGGGGLDFLFIPVGDNRIWSIRAPLPDLQRSTIALEAGALIGASPETGHWSGNTDAVNMFDFGPVVFSIIDTGNGVYRISTIPQFETRYLALEYHMDDGIHYGWIAISSWLAHTNSADIHGWAYETEPNKPIFAGVIPEPSAAALGGAAVAALTWHHRRRRRGG